jgi:hypothetical protein
MSGGWYGSSGLHETLKQTQGDVMKLKVLAALAALMMLTGCGAAAEAKDLQEDDPGWNCYVHGNKVCGANPIERTEAWAKFDLDADKTVGGSGARVTYLGLSLAGTDAAPSNHVTIPSDVTPGKIHVFEVVR